MNTGNGENKGPQRIYFSQEEIISVGEAQANAEPDPIKAKKIRDGVEGYRKMIEEKKGGKKGMSGDTIGDMYAITEREAPEVIPGQSGKNIQRNIDEMQADKIRRAIANANADTGNEPEHKPAMYMDVKGIKEKIRQKTQNAPTGQFPMPTETTTQPEKTQSTGVWTRVKDKFAEWFR